MNTEYLFVYGTLQKDSGHEMSKFLAKHAEFFGKGYFHGKLFMVSWYPGAILGDNISEKVFGTVFKIDNPPEVFEVLDDYEGISQNYSQPHLYRRELVATYLDNKTTLKTWVYIYNLPVNDLKQIISGDFFNIDR